MSSESLALVACCVCPGGHLLGAASPWLCAPEFPLLAGSAPIFWELHPRGRALLNSLCWLVLHASFETCTAVAARS